MLSKLTSTLDSRNFFVTLISIVLAALQFNSIETGYTAEGIFDLFKDANLSSALILLVVNFLNPIMKIVNKVINKGFDWSFVKSRNFVTQVLSLLTILISALFDEITVGIISALVVNVWNLVSHLLDKDKTTTDDAIQQ